MPNNDCADIPFLSRWSSDENLVRHLLSSVNVSKASGCDGIF